MTSIPELLAAGKAFALYRQPGHEAALVRQAAGQPTVHTGIPTGEALEGFVFAPFAPCAERPIIILGPGCVTEQWTPVPDDQPALEWAPPAGICFSGEKFRTYSKAFSSFSAEVRSGSLIKLVLSRAADFDRRADFSPEKVFATACARYPAAFVSLFFSLQTGLWLGISPELLLGGEGGCWQTAAVAGTLPAEEERAAPWNAKNRREQQVVADFIGASLEALGITPRREEPVTCRAGNVAHIKSDFFFSLPKETSPWDVIAALHPTPAVCGMPKEKAKRFILDNEGYDREYYSGFLGPVGQKTSVYVNLRCMKVEEGFLRLFAGGGIMPESSLEQEWEETDHKMRTLLAVL